MIREYRGKRKDGGEWVEGWYVEMRFEVEGGDRPVDELKDCILPKGSSEEDVFFEVIPETVGQYTGFKDKNGEKSYPGNVYQIEADVYEVRWDDGLARFYLRGLYSPCSSHLCHKNMGLVCDAELIGNIHENPELMEMRNV